LDNTKIKGPQDSSRININEEYEVRYWTKALSVSKEKLEQAVRKVGPSAEAVKKELAA
jgi:hypothetical protein